MVAHFEFCMIPSSLFFCILYSVFFLLLYSVFLLLLSSSFRFPSSFHPHRCGGLYVSVTGRTVGVGCSCVARYSYEPGAGGRAERRRIVRPVTAITAGAETAEQKGGLCCDMALFQNLVTFGIPLLK